MHDWYCGIVFFEGVIVFGYIQNFPGSTCTGSTCTQVLLVLSKFEIILFNSCPHRQWWFRKYAMFFKVIRVLQLSVYLWFYIKFNLNIFFLLKKSFAAGIHYSNVWVIVNCPPQRVSWWNAVHNDLLKLLLKNPQILFIIYAESNRSGIYLLQTNNAVAGSTVSQIIYDDFFCNWLMIDWIAVSIFHNVCMLVQFLKWYLQADAVIGSL